MMIMFQALHSVRGFYSFLLSNIDLFCLKTLQKLVLSSDLGAIFIKAEQLNDVTANKLVVYPLLPVSKVRCSDLNEYRLLHLGKSQIVFGDRD